jgi:hypothetical protein
MSYQPTKWSELLYVQRQPEDKDQFAANWDLIFGKKDTEQSQTPKQLTEQNTNGK